MSRYFPKYNDKDGWKKGAGVYSRSYLKTTTKSPTMRGYQTANEYVSFKGYETPEAGGSVQKLIAGKSVFSRADAASKVNYGLSGALPRGHRPVHKAKSSAGGSGVDRPDTPKWRKFKDWS